MRQAGNRHFGSFLLHLFGNLDNEQKISLSAVNVVDVDDQGRTFDSFRAVPPVYVPSVGYLSLVQTFDSRTDLILGNGTDITFYGDEAPRDEAGVLFQIAHKLGGVHRTSDRWPQHDLGKLWAPGEPVVSNAIRNRQIAVTNAILVANDIDLYVPLPETV